MKRAMNPDGTPWWVSTGPPSRVTENPKVEPMRMPEPEPRSEAPEAPREEPAAASSAQGFFGIPLEVQAGAINSALNLAAAIAGVLAQPLAGSEEKPQPAAVPHSIDTCGTCPLCVAVTALKHHDPRLGSAVESAMAGVTGSAEKLAGLLPNAIDSLTEAAVSAVVRTLLNPRS